jgi:hypothetical protein
VSSQSKLRESAHRAASLFKLVNVTACIEKAQKQINFAIVEIAEFKFRQMLIERPNHKELTPDEIQSLQKLRVVIDQAIADGRVSKYEMDLIERTIKSDNKVLVEEVVMVRQLIRDKLDSGLLTQEWDK